MDSWSRAIRLVRAWAIHLGPHVAAAAFLCWPLLPRDVILVSGDLNNHVRHVHESMLALAEGQWPPILAPSLNHDLRLRIFQLYSGTAFLLPGLLSFVLAPYTALKVVLVCSSILGAVSIRAVARTLGSDDSGALLGAMAFQLAPFPTLDLLNRGAWPEWLALQVGAVVLLAALRVVELPTRARFCGFVAALAFLIPCHPLQTGLLAIPIAALVGAFAYQRGLLTLPRVGLVTLAAASAFMLTAWFWEPMLSVWSEQRMVACEYTHAYFGTPLRMVLWPWPRRDGGGLWFSVQLGLPLLLGLCVGPWVAWRRRSAPLAACVVLGWCLLVAVVTGEQVKAHLPRLAEALSSLQFTYRYLIPATLVGALALAGVASLLRHNWWARVGVVVIAVHAAPYVVWCKYTPDGWPRYTSTAEALAPEFESANSGFYSLVGTDYRLPWTTKEGLLRLDEKLALPGGRVAFRARLLGDGLGELYAEDLRKHALSISDCAESPADSCREIQIPTSALFGVRFRSPRPVRVGGMMFRPAGDSGWIRLPGETLPEQVADARYSARVRVSEDGPYQLPVAYFPSDVITVDGEQAQHASHDKTLVVVELTPGEHVVQVVTRRGVWSFAFTLGGVLLAGVGMATRMVRRHPGRHPADLVPGPAAAAAWN